MDLDVIRIQNIHMVDIADAALVTRASALLAGELEAVLHVCGGELAKPPMELDALLQLEGPNVAGGVHLPRFCQHGDPFAGVGIQLHQVFHERTVLVHEVHTALPRYNGVVDGGNQPQDDLVRRQLALIHYIAAGLVLGSGHGGGLSGGGRRAPGCRLRCSRLGLLSRGLGASACCDECQEQQRW